MSYAIIGFGKIGQALAKVFARKGIEVSVASTLKEISMYDQSKLSETT
jgi:predicted dinucleotide-binding enzyme